MPQITRIKELYAGIEDKPILNGIDFQMKSGEIHALMGPNGSGKSTLAHVLMGHPGCRVGSGQFLFNGENMLTLEPHERAQRGIFLAFQYPVEVGGVTVGKFLKRAVELSQNGKKMNVSAYIKELRAALDFLEMDQEFINRYLNQGFSGGEKKRMEIVQMLMLKPALAILDETDSGLDIDALKIVARGVNKLRGDGFTALIITHYQRILDHIKPDYVHIMYRGRIVASGGSDFARTLEKRGYDWIREKYGIEEEIDA